MPSLTRISASALLALSLSTLGACGGDDDAPAPPSRGYDAISYDLHARYDWDASKLYAREDIRVALASTAADAIVELDAEVDLKEVTSAAGALPHTYDETAHKLKIDLTPLMPASGPVDFTVVYEAAPSDALIAALPTTDDPVRSRVVFTDSEPDRGLLWRVAKEDPSDRALWSVDLEVAEDEDVIANGARLHDDPVGSAGHHVVAYALDKPIPTYLMAFAAGQLDHTDRPTGSSVPLAVWYRKGLPIQPDSTLDAVADAMSSFEKLLGPYPWDSYAVVLVPQYGGGMENATVTFDSEASGLGNVSFGLNAHELGHHWFGDWVTMRGYADVWVKEGMATLLAAEASRGRRDREHKGRYFGTDFSFNPDDAIVDPMLTGLDRYTSGPYERAAWTISQIRARVGEEAFWASLRQVLADHALDSIDGESFVRAFAPALDEAAITQVLASLETKEVPNFAIATAPNAANAADTDVTFELGDPAHLLLDGLAITVVDAAGQATTSELVPGTPLTVTVPAGGYLAPDEQDLHPYWSSSFLDRMETYSLLLPFLIPPPGPALDAFESRSAAAQERAIVFTAATLTPEQLGGYYDHLDSDVAKRQASFDACFALSQVAPDQPDVAAAWASALTPIVKTPAQASFTTRYASCGVPLATSALGPELEAAAAAPTPVVTARLEYLMGFDYGAAATMAALGTLATSAPTLRLRDQAFNRLAFQAQGYYSDVPPEQHDVWTAFFRGPLADAVGVSRFMNAWAAEVALADPLALPIGAMRLHTLPLSDAQQRQIVCDAFHVGAADATLFPAFQDTAQPWTSLSTAAQEVLADPTKCDM
jgi:aminopeptidase N